MSLIAWTDIETNGIRLNEHVAYPRCAELLEVGVFVTDAEMPFKFRGAVNQVIMPVDLTAEEIFTTMPDVVFEMHEKSGLNDYFRHVKTILAIEAAEIDIIDLLSKYGEEEDYIFAGRGVSWFDRPWIEAMMPDLAAWYHPYRTLDLSHFSRVMKMAGRDEPKFKEDMKHRAVNDAQRHYEEFLNYVEYIAP